MSAGLILVTTCTSCTRRHARTCSRHRLEETQARQCIGFRVANRTGDESWGPHAGQRVTAEGLYKCCSAHRQVEAVVQLLLGDPQLQVLRKEDEQCSRC